jgi:hypothetical protein
LIKEGELERGDRATLGDRETTTLKTWEGRGVPKTEPWKAKEVVPWQAWTGGRDRWKGQEPHLGVARTWSLNLLTCSIHTHTHTHTHNQNQTLESRIKVALFLRAQNK